MQVPHAEIQTLSEALVDEIFKALALDPSGWPRRRFGPLFHRATGRLAKIGLTFDRTLSSRGFPEAAGWALTHFTTAVRARGAEQPIPQGPLLVVSNHPGTYDALVIGAHLGRRDIKIISSDIPFLKYLPNVHRHIIFISQNAYERMAGARTAARHLEEGGAVLLFGSGHIDPDPAIFPDAKDHISAWSPSIELLLRLVPDARLLLAVVSGVLSPGWARHPVTWLRRDGLAKRRLAEFGQVIQQLLSPGKHLLQPAVSFSGPLRPLELGLDQAKGGLLQEVVRRGHALLDEHQSACG
jgi:hypothetical protein